MLIIVSLLDVHVHHEVPRTQAPNLLTIPVFVILELSPVLTNILQSSYTFNPTPIQTTLTPSLTIETINPLSTLPDFSLVFRFNDRIIALEKEVDELKKDPLHTQVTSLVDIHLETRLGETKGRIHDVPFRVSHNSNRQKGESESYLTALENRDCYDGLKKSYKLDMDYFSSYDVYCLKRSRKDKDKDEDPSAGSDRGLKKRKLSKDAKPIIEPINKDSTSGSSKGTKSQPKSSGKSVQSEELVFEIANSDMPQDQEGILGDNKDEPRKETTSRQEPVFEIANSDMPQDQEGILGNNKDEPRKETTSRRDWFKKPTPPQELTDPDWNVGKTTQEGPTQNWLMNLAASTSTDKSLKDFDELMSTLIDLSGYILNGLKIENLTQENAMRLSEKLDWENPKGGDYPFDLSKPLPLIKSRKHQRVPFEFFINNDLKGMQSRGYVYPTKRILAVTYVSVMRKHRYGSLEEIVNQITNLLSDDVADFAIALRRFTRSLVIQRRVEDLQLGVKSYQKQINITKPDTTRPYLRKRHSYTPYKDPQGFIYVNDFGRNKLMRSDKLYKFSDCALTRLLSSLKDITKNIDMTYLPKRRWSNLEKK
nr:hypothetical protein [Tanacetum cinerariifolium]